MPDMQPPTMSRLLHARYTLKALPAKRAMTEARGWDGLPQNPQQDGFHMLNQPSIDSHTVARWDAADGVWSLTGDEGEYTPEEMAEEHEYLAPCEPPAAPCALDRLLQAAEQVLDDMQDGTSCCPAARDALRDALVPFRARLAEIDGVPLPAAPCADEVEVVARAIAVKTEQDEWWIGFWRSRAGHALAALSPLRQAERERAFRDGAEATRTALAVFVDARGARGLAYCLLTFPLPPMGGV